MRKIRFAPGKGNQKLIAMYNDGAEVWDTKEVLSNSVFFFKVCFEEDRRIVKRKEVNVLNWGLSVH